MRFLRSARALPAHGVALLATADRLWAFEPPRPLRRRIYHCGTRFQLDGLREQARDNAAFGVVVIEGNKSKRRTHARGPRCEIASLAVRAPCNHRRSLVWRIGTELFGNEHAAHSPRRRRKKKTRNSLLRV